MPDGAWPLLCPACSEDLLVERRADARVAGLSCPAGHRFDAARQGHVNLLTGRASKFREDTPAMVASRERWLASGGYAALGEALAAAAVRHVRPRAEPLTVVDTGSGTGWYTRRVLDGLEGAGHRARAVDMDLSRAGAQRAARDPRVLSLVWDTWRAWPLRGACADVLLDVFAPRNEPEFARVLSPGGVALVAVPLPGHLSELADEAGLLGIDRHKEERLAAIFGPGWEELPPSEVHARLSLAPEDAADLAHMGPAGHHRDREEILAGLRPGGVRSVGAHVRLHAYRRGEVIPVDHPRG